eukprot:1352074-Prymnesium_polylepis.1
MSGVPLASALRTLAATSLVKNSVLAKPPYPHVLGSLRPCIVYTPLSPALRRQPPYCTRTAIACPHPG